MKTKDKLDRCKECHVLGGQPIEARMSVFLGEFYCSQCLLTRFILNWESMADSLAKQQEKFLSDMAHESIETINLIADQGKKNLVLMAKLSAREREITELKTKLEEKK